MDSTAGTKSSSAASSVSPESTLASASSGATTSWPSALTTMQKKTDKARATFAQRVSASRLARSAPQIEVLRSLFVSDFCIEQLTAAFAAALARYPRPVMNVSRIAGDIYNCAKGLDPLRITTNLSWHIIVGTNFGMCVEAERELKLRDRSSGIFLYMFCK